MVNNTILYNSSSASILYMKKREYMYLAIEGYVNTATLSEFSKALLNGVIYNHVKKILFDTSQVNIIKNEDIQWIRKNILPFLVKNGVSRVAFIKPQNAFGNLSIEALAKIMNEKFDAQIFQTMQPAEEWLFQDKNSFL